MLLGICVAYGTAAYLSIKSAERKAQAFCDGIAPGSTISAAVARAKAQEIFYGCSQNEGCTFYFPTIDLFDKAVCEVSVDANERVSSRGWVMEFD